MKRIYCKKDIAPDTWALCMNDRYVAVHKDDTQMVLLKSECNGKWTHAASLTIESYWDILSLINNDKEWTGEIKEYLEAAANYQEFMFHFKLMNMG